MSILDSLYKRSVKRVLFINSILFSTSTILVLGLLFSFTLYRQKLADSRQMLAERNLSINSFMENFFSETKSTVTFLSRLEPVIAGPEGTEEEQAVLLELYDQIMSANGSIAYLYSGYSGGTLLVNDYIVPEDYDPRTRPWYVSAMESSPEVSICEPYREISTRQWLSASSRVLKDGSGKMRGVISLEYELAHLASLLEKRHSAFHSSYSFVFKRNGDIILHRYSDRLGLNIFDVTASLTPELFKESEGFLDYRYDRRRMIGYYSKIEENGWVIVTVVERKELSSPILIRMGLSILFVFFLSLFWGALQSRMLSRRIVEPLVQLKDHAASIVAGREGEREGASDWIYPDNEIGQIAANTMELARDELLKKNRELEAGREELLELSNTDQLTGLLNRRCLEGILQSAVERYGRYGTDLSVLLIDIDFFKKINDSFGHDAGDEVLKSISFLFQRHIRRSDSSGRWGGEEFLIVCPETDLSGAVPLAEKIRFMVEKHEFLTGGEVTVSIGVAAMDADMTRDELLKCADRNLYRAKQLGRNQVSVGG